MKTILVIDDNQGNLKLFRGILGLFENCRLLESNTAESGIQLARTEIPDLILMDIQLPGMNGYEATRSIKADEALKTYRSSF